MSETKKTVVRDALLVDGTGAPARPADVVVADDRITEVLPAGRAGTAHAHRIIDADGLLLTPGWVDIHTHYDAQATWDPWLTPSSWHGVTTALMGNCGVGFAPAAEDRHEWLIELMEGVEDIPGSAMTEGMTWGWRSFPEYLDALERIPRVIDIGTQIGHGALRAFVMACSPSRTVVAGVMFASCSPRRMTSLTRVSRARPSEPPGWRRAKSSA
jgi:N-acyl-D-aspartate/D-glutamate deacylase